MARAFQVQTEEKSVASYEKSLATEAARVKNEFIGNVSHELRTPLTSIAACLGLLCDTPNRDQPDVASKLLGIALSNSQRLIRLVNDILDIEKLEAGKVKFNNQRVEVGLIARRAVEICRPVAEGLSVAIRLEEQGSRYFAYVDPDRLVQVLSNLLSNAMKFSPENAVVLMSIDQRPGWVRLSVRDYGPGIPEEFKSKLFEKFAQADPSNYSPKGGTGLGLSIVKNIVDRMDGKVGFIQPEDGGSLFFVDLPELRKSAVADRSSLVLVCEDDIDTAQIICKRLRLEGFEVDHAENGGIAIKLAGEKSYATILVDLTLPDIDGISLIQLLRQLPLHRDTPILVVSANPGRGQEDVRACKLKIVDWLEKPFDTKKVGDQLRQLLDRRGTKPARVLHVDQDVDTLTVMAEVLESDAVVVSTMTVEAARQALQSQSFDLAVVQLDLARVSDAEILPSLQGADGSELPVVVYSPKAENPDLAERVRIVLTKSQGSLDALVDIVKKSVTQSGTIQELHS